MIAFGLSVIKETLEDCSQMLRDSGKRREEWTVVKTDQVSRQTAKNKLHGLSFPKTSAAGTPAEKKTVDYLYIDADEDHVSLQFKEKKGDLEMGENNWKISSSH